jgi:asparagine synthase (glutamine-hydrolysing)
MVLDGLDVPAVLNGRDPLNKSLFVWAKSFFAQLHPQSAWRPDGNGVLGLKAACRSWIITSSSAWVAPVSLKIRGVTEKYLLREAAKPQITETVYRRQKHPFLSPPVTTVPTDRFHQMMQDTLRGPSLRRYRFTIRRRSSPCSTNYPRCQIGTVWGGIRC